MLIRDEHPNSLSSLPVARKDIVFGFLLDPVRCISIHWWCESMVWVALILFDASVFKALASDA